ncbi:hypothetical protein [Frigoriglobus tundricola]|uniref:hypothetical protein n=1 Tax=Frigoriglobus tundricola TaxID=2774151 RepID=UPI00148EE8C5|nr:hypothetical protein [Frigoriglobus tundricola]
MHRSFHSTGSESSSGGSGGATGRGASSSGGAAGRGGSGYAVTGGGPAVASRSRSAPRRRRQDRPRHHQLRERVGGADRVPARVTAVGAGEEHERAGEHQRRDERAQTSTAVRP